MQLQNMNVKQHSHTGFGLLVNRLPIVRDGRIGYLVVSALDYGLEAVGSGPDRAYDSKNSPPLLAAFQKKVEYFPFIGRSSHNKKRKKKTTTKNNKTESVLVTITDHS